MYVEKLCINHFIVFQEDKNFVRTIAKADGTPATLSESHAIADELGLNDAQDAKIEDMIMTDSKFLFRRRSSAPPPVVQKPVIIQTNTFLMNFYAKEVKAIKVQPGDWFDRFVLQYNVF